MTEHKQTRSVPWLWASALFACCYTYLLVWANPRWSYEEGPWFPCFKRGWDFLESYLVHPGGPVGYVAAVCSQLYRIPWAGPLVGTAVGALIALGAWLTLRSQLRCSFLSLASVSLVPVLVTYGLFGYHLPSFVALATALLGAGLLASIRCDSKGLRSVLFLCVGSVVYYSAGGAYLLCVLMVALPELGRSPDDARQRAFGLTVLVVGQLLPLVIGMAVLDAGALDAFTLHLPCHTTTHHIGRLPVLALFFLPVLASLRANGFLGNRQNAGPGRLAALLDRLRQRLANPALRHTCCITGAVLIVILSSSPNKRRSQMISCANREGRWPDVLQQAEKLPSGGFSLSTTYAVNCALHEEGRLLTEMFSIPQLPDSLNLGLALEADCGVELYRMHKDAFLELGDIDLRFGMVNEAEHWAHESLETAGSYDAVLKRLVRVNLVKRRPEVARVLLNMMQRELLPNAWAAERLKQLDNAAAVLLHAPDIELIRSRMLRRDRVVTPVPLDERCRISLAANPANRMAFEYLMAHCLITRDLKTFAKEAGRIVHIDYAELPVHVAEAALLCKASAGIQVTLGHWRIPPLTQQRLDRFMAVTMPHLSRGDAQTAGELAAPAYGNTYFFYCTFGRSGVGDK